MGLASYLQGELRSGRNASVRLSCDDQPVVRETDQAAGEGAKGDAQDQGSLRRGDRQRHGVEQADGEADRNEERPARCWCADLAKVPRTVFLKALLEGLHSGHGEATEKGHGGPRRQKALEARDAPGWRPTYQ